MGDDGFFYDVVLYIDDGKLFVFGECLVDDVFFDEGFFFC